METVEQQVIRAISDLGASARPSLVILPLCREHHRPQVTAAYWSLLRAGRIDRSTAGILTVR